MLVSLELYAELLADQQEQKERRHRLLSSSWTAVEQQRQEEEEQQQPQQPRTLATPVLPPEDSIEILWPHISLGAETAFHTVDDEAAAAALFLAAQLQHQDTALAIARSRVTPGHVAAAGSVTNTGTADACVSLRVEQEAKAKKAPSLQAGGPAPAKTIVHAHSETPGEGQPQSSALPQERAGGGSSAVTDSKTPSSIQQAARQGTASVYAAPHKEEVIESSSPQAVGTRAVTALQGKGQQPKSQSEHPEQLLRQQAHIVQPQREPDKVPQEQFGEENSCPYWCVPTEGCYTTQPVFAASAGARGRAMPQQQQSSRQLKVVTARQPHQRVTLLEEAEAFVAQAAVSAAATELLRVQQEHLLHQGLHQELLQHGPVVQLRKVPRHLSVYVAEVTCRMFFDPQYRAKLLHED